MSKKVIKKFENKYFILKDTRLEAMGIEKYKNTYWIECDENGNVVDNPETKTILCKIPMGYDDIDVETLKDDCLWKK